MKHGMGLLLFHLIEYKQNKNMPLICKTVPAKRISCFVVFAYLDTSSP